MMRTIILWVLLGLALLAVFYLWATRSRAPIAPKNSASIGASDSDILGDIPGLGFIRDVLQKTSIFSPKSEKGPDTRNGGGDDLMAPSWA